MKKRFAIGMMILSLILAVPAEVKAEEGRDVILEPSKTVGKEFSDAFKRVCIKSKDLSDRGILYPGYSEEDLYILAHVICGEAQGYPDDEQLYVGSVVLNRVNHPSFPNTISGVVFQRGQYGCTKDGNYYREPTAQNWANARMLLENGSVLPGNVVWQSGGRQGRGEYLRTRYHSYCY